MRRLAVLCIILNIALTAAHAQSDERVAEFYRGKPLSIVIGHESGTGYDFFGRVLARHIPRHMPGNPHAVPQNMPGAGGLRAANWLYNVAPKDGTVVSVFAPETALKSIFGDAAVTFESEKFAWIGNMDESVATCAVSARSGIASLDQLMQREAIFGATGQAAPTSKFAYALINFLGARIKIVQGYKGSAALKIALTRGEIEGACGMSHSTLKTQWQGEIASGQVRPLVQFGLSRRSDLPDAAHIYDYAKSAEDRAIFDVAFGPHVLGRPLLAPPGVPDERVRALRAAFTETMRDADVLAEMGKHGLDIAPSSGEQVEALVARFAAMPKHIIAKATAGMHEKR